MRQETKGSSPCWLKVLGLRMYQGSEGGTLREADEHMHIDARCHQHVIDGQGVIDENIDDAHM